jgi:hypothetical protein
MPKAELHMNTTAILAIVLAYCIGSILIGIPMAVASIQVWRDGAIFRRWEGQDADYTGGFWGFVLFPKTAFSECIGRHASEPWGIRVVGLDTCRGYQKYFVLTMLLWLPRICCNALSFTAFTLAGFSLLMLDRISPRCGDAVTMFVRKHITRVEGLERL